jgi:uncharacterized membrane protein YfcA
MLYALLIFLGIVGGLIAGMLGLGGGVVYILFFPHFLAWLGFPPEVISGFVVANSLMGITFASGAAMIADFRNVKKYYTETLIIALAAVLVSILTTVFLVHAPWFSKTIFNSIVIFILLYILLQIFSGGKFLSQTESTNPPIGNKNGLFSGALTGFISAASGLGGGAIIIPLLRMKFNQSQLKAKTISLSIMFASSLIISIQNLQSEPSYQHVDSIQWGYILPAAIFPMVAGIGLGSPFGVYMARKIKPEITNRIFIAFLLIALFEKMITLF